MPGTVRTFGSLTALPNRRSRRSSIQWYVTSLTLVLTVDLDALARAAISSSRLVHCPSDNITEKIMRITRSSAGVKILKDAFGNSRTSCRIDAHLLRDGAHI